MPCFFYLSNNGIFGLSVTSFLCWTETSINKNAQGVLDIRKSLLVDGKCRKVLKSLCGQLGDIECQ